MRKRVILFFFLCTAVNVCAQKFELAPPFLKYNSVFFQKTQEVVIKFQQPGTIIRYTLDGTEPGVKSKVYKTPLLIAKHNQVLKAKVFGQNFIASETVSARFVKNGKKIANCICSSPSSKYPGNVKNLLYDDKGGSASFGDGTWMGFDADTVSFQIKLAQKESVSSVLANLMESQGSWIFLPQSVRLYSIENGVKKEVDLQKTEKDDKEHKASLSHLKMFNLIKPTVTDYLVLEMEIVKKIPDWHPAKGEHAWLFIDEIKVY